MLSYKNGNFHKPQVSDLEVRKFSPVTLSVNYVSNIKKSVKNVYYLILNVIIYTSSRIILESGRFNFE